MEILYRDDYLIAINKPSGLLVHKSMIDRHEIYYAMKLLRDQLGGQWVYPVHRLDKPTSGVLLFALESETARLLSEQFKEHSIKKEYIAVVRGYTEEKGKIVHALKEKLDKISDKKARKDKDAQEAVTDYERLAVVELDYAVGRYEKTRYSLVKLLPQTGRKHQLRRHMKHISHHILGDTKYGRGEHNKFIRSRYSMNRLLLHCNALEIVHPYTEEALRFEAGYDEVFMMILNEFGWRDKV
ncbi:tRNA pseudouridine(65) synthase TruC [Sulfurimonas paralvinellae]|uniref:tRNA pseudouridine(65) synthase TruC n=1 Tax=Sulfurimonas paralvinellae TaxID=317658 RepID=UPI001D05C139|nr:tRNA pseudouridine(65) synthase TruC [Sulfurimonas paralvinellae]